MQEREEREVNMPLPSGKRDNINLFGSRMGEFEHTIVGGKKMVENPMASRLGCHFSGL